MPSAILTPQDIVAAASVANFKFIESRVSKHKRKGNQKGAKELNNKLLGYMGEAGFAQIMGMEWPTASTYDFDSRKLGDFVRNGHTYEIKTSRGFPYLSEFCETVIPGRVYVLMMATDMGRLGQQLELVGWCYSSRVLVSGFKDHFNDGRVSYIVPMKELKPPHTMPI